MHQEFHHRFATALLTRTKRALGVAALAMGACLAVDMQYVIVGDPGNPTEPNNIHGIPNLGSVAAAFRMGKYEVTNAQYAEFLNAKAASDPYGLYDGRMDADATHGGIVRGGSEGSYTYSVKSGFAAKPVVYVNFFDAARFANWLHNGQGAANTEHGAYSLTPNPGNPPLPVNGETVGREPAASVFLPNENEWYKAAYYAGGGLYWQYPTRSSTAPTAEPPPGGANSATVGGVLSGGMVTAVGAHAQAFGPYGTFDQGGNAAEWLETTNGPYRILRGGHFNNDAAALGSEQRGYGFANEAYEHSGFRVASAIPPPEVPAPSRGLGKIMPLGDSLTQSQNDLFSYRYWLWKMLLDQGVEFDLVGTLIDNGINGYPPWPNHQGQAFDQHHEGHSGLRTEEIAAQVSGWMAGYVPDVVLLIAGTNDALQGRDPPVVIGNLKAIIGHLRARNSQVSVFLAKLPPVHASITWQGTPVNTAIGMINDLIAEIPNDPALAGARITIVDLNTGFDFATEGRSDGIHPNEAGEQKIAARFFEALQVSAHNSSPGVDSAGHLTMTFLRIQSPFQLTYTVEVSGNLQQWLSGPSETEQINAVDHSNGTETVVIRDRKSPATDGQRFIRLRLNY